jgi:hypothetical protein
VREPVSTRTAVDDRDDHGPLFFFHVMISHESYQRGEICVALTESGHQLDDAVLYDQWDWGKR